MSNYDPEIIPRPIGRVKAQLIAKFNLGLKDILVFVGVLFVFAFFAFMFIENIWARFGVGFGLGLFFGVVMLVGEPNRRVYNNIYKMFLFMISKKKYKGKEINRLFSYQTIENSHIKDKSGRFIKVLKIEGSNILNAQIAQGERMISHFANFFVGMESSFYINKIESKFNTKKNNDFIKKIMSKTKNDKTKKEILKHNLEISQWIGKEDNNFPTYFMVISNRNLKTLEENAKHIKNQLSNCSINTLVLTGGELYRYAISSVFPGNKFDAKFKDIDFNAKNKYEDLIDIKNVEFRSSFIKYENKFMRVVAVDQFPIHSSLAWLSSIFNIKGASVFMRHYGLSQANANKLLDKAHQEMRMRAIGTNTHKLSDSSNQAIYMRSMEDLAQKVQGTGERLYEVQLYIVVSADNHRELQQIERQVYSEIGKNRMKVDKLTFCQLQGFLSISASGDVDDFYNRNTLEIGSSALSHGWPFISEGFNDESGFYLGLTMTGKPVFLDWAYRNSLQNRNQSNSIVFGATGKGKSTFVKKVLKDEFARGIKAYIVDPENEYEELAKNVGGTYIDLSGKANADGKIERLNPLQPFSVGESIARNPLDVHFKFLEAFFRSLLYPGVEDTVLQMGYLKFAIGKLYQEKKIKPNEEDAKKWPILTDLHQYLIKLAKGKKVDENFYNNDLFMELAERLYDLTTKGGEGNLWDGHTTLSVENDQMVVFNIQELYSSGNMRLVNSQMFLMLNYLTYLIQRNKRANATKRDIVNVSITIDEAHLLVNKDNPTTLKFAYNMYKRIRKYDGWIRFVTQNIADFTGSEDIKRETSAILNAAQFMFVFGLNPSDIKDLDSLLRETGGLTDYEKSFLNFGETHSAIFLSGSSYRSAIQFEYTDQEKAIWGWKN